jgi:hypothetical protein
MWYCIFQGYPSLRNGRGDGSLVKVGPILEMVGDWKKFLEGESTADEAKQLRQHEQVDRPLGKCAVY